jgi:hypothetical protein
MYTAIVMRYEDYTVRCQQNQITPVERPDYEANPAAAEDIVWKVQVQRAMSATHTHFTDDQILAALFGEQPVVERDRRYTLSFCPNARWPFNVKIERTAGEVVAELDADESNLRLFRLI